MTPKPNRTPAASDLLVLVKHAPPDVVPGTPPDEWHLSADGVAAADRLAARLAPLAIDVVVSSLEPKAMETAKVVAAALDVTFHTGDDLHEHRRRTAGYSSEEVFEASIRGLFERRAEVVFGEESGAAAEQRFTNALDALVKAHRGDRLAVVAHGTVIALHLEARYGLDGFSVWRRLGLPSYVVVDQRTRSLVDVVDRV